MNAIKETHLFFEAGEHRLFGVYYEPKTRRKNLSFLFVHAFGEEKLWAQRVFVNYARKLSADGYGALRFDLFGHGDSEGDFRDATVNGWLRDIGHAWRTVNDMSGGSGQIGIIGVRLGATLGIMASESIENVKAVVAWEPIVDGAKYASEIVRSNIAMQSTIFGEIKYNRTALENRMKENMPLNCEGYEISYEMYDQVRSIKLAEQAKDFRTPCAVVQIGQAESGPRADIKNLTDSHSKSTLLISRGIAFWKDVRLYCTRSEELYDATSEWIEQQQGL